MRKLALTNILPHYIFDEEISAIHRAKISRMKNDLGDPVYALYFPVGCYRETSSHAYEDKDNRNTFQGLRCGYSRSYGGNKTANTQGTWDPGYPENPSSSLLFATATPTCDSKSFTMLSNNSDWEKGRFARLYDLWHIVTFIQLSILPIGPAKISARQIRSRRSQIAATLTIVAIRKRSIMCPQFSHFFDRPIMHGPRDPYDLLTLCVRDRMRFREVFTERDVKFTNINVQRFLLKTF